MDNKLKVLIGLAVTTGVVAFVVTRPKYANATAPKKRSSFWDRQAHLNFWNKIFTARAKNYQKK